MFFLFKRKNDIKDVPIAMFAISEAISLGLSDELNAPFYIIASIPEDELRKMIRGMGSTLVIMNSIV